MSSTLYQLKINTATPRCKSRRAIVGSIAFKVAGVVQRSTSGQRAAADKCSATQPSTGQQVIPLWRTRNELLASGPSHADS